MFDRASCLQGAVLPTEKNLSQVMLGALGAVGILLDNDSGNNFSAENSLQNTEKSAEVAESFLILPAARSSCWVFRKQIESVWCL
ncbi:hypothetical protein RQN30_00465 [Arcanobacterium hippocoleae]